LLLLLQSKKTTTTLVAVVNALEKWTFISKSRPEHLRGSPRFRKPGLRSGPATDNPTPRLNNAHDVRISNKASTGRAVGIKVATVESLTLSGIGAGWQ